jgi:hypothetical protein
MYGESNVAFAGCGTLVATDENGVTSEKKLTTGFNTPPNSGYIASSDITKEIAVSWIESALGDLLTAEKTALENNLTVFKIIRWD